MRPRRTWARTWPFWRRVARPVLAPSFVGAMMLLFAKAFAAYATALAVGTGIVPLITPKIAAALSGDVLVG